MSTRRLPTTKPSALSRAAQRCEEALRRAWAAENYRLIYRLPSVAQLTDTSVETIRAWIRRGDLVATKIGSAVYVARDDLLDFIERNRAKRTASAASAMERGQAGRFVGGKAS